MGLKSTDLTAARADATARQGNISLGDERDIIFDTAIGERKTGVIYTVDSSLAHHYCEVMKVARLVESAPASDASKPEAPAMTGDRAMKPPPRGKKAEA